MLKALPLLDDLAREPNRAIGLSREHRGLLLSRCAAILAALSAPDDGVAGAGPEVGEPEQERERLLTVPEVSELLGFARGYTYELLRRGEIRALHHGKYWRVRQSALAEFIENYEARGHVARSVSQMLGRLRERTKAPGGPPAPRPDTDPGGSRDTALMR